MAVTAEELAARYPFLYHMAHRDSWKGIRDHGLLSTEALVRDSELSDADKAEILTKRRSECREINHQEIGLVSIRDQKSLSVSKVTGSLTDCTFDEWLKLLNERVFFWLCIPRLVGFMSAKAYRNQSHLVLKVRTLSLVRAHADRVKLTPLNTGATSPMAFPRGRLSFMGLAQYPFEERRKYGKQKQVAELTIERGVPNLIDFIDCAALGHIDKDTMRLVFETPHLS